MVTTFFLLRYIRTANLSATLMQVTKTRPAGCGLYAVPDTGKNRTCTPFSTAAIYTTGLFEISRLAGNCWCGTMINTISIWAYRPACMTWPSLIQLVSHVIWSSGPLLIPLPRLVTQPERLSMHQLTSQWLTADLGPNTKKRWFTRKLKIALQIAFVIVFVTKEQTGFPLQRVCFCLIFVVYLIVVALEYYHCYRNHVNLVWAVEILFLYYLQKWTVLFKQEQHLSWFKFHRSFS